MQLTWLLLLCLAVAGTLGKKDSSEDSDAHEPRDHHPHKKSPGKGHDRMNDAPLARTKRGETTYHVRGRIFQPDHVSAKATIRPGVSQRRQEEIDREARERQGRVRGTYRPAVSPGRSDEIEKEARQQHGRVIEEMKNRFKNYRENCYPRPKNGCRCVENSKVVLYDKDELCRITAAAAG